MTVGHEWAHTQFVSQGEGLPKGGFSWLNLWRITMRRDLAEEAQGIRLVTPFMVRMAECQCPLSERMILLQTTSQGLRFPQRETTERLKVCYLHACGLFRGLRQERHGLRDAPS